MLELFTSFSTSLGMSKQITTLASLKGKARCNTDSEYFTLLGSKDENSLCEISAFVHFDPIKKDGLT
uniref:Uncharacterized protein n=1 Tax=Vespula pensylvanica TaxID=30213 RepID=A0A834UDL3_VESPE|nr:hypothetical protein H0235_005167 [Vespula pensylvanica]